MGGLNNWKQILALTAELHKRWWLNHANALRHKQLATRRRIDPAGHSGVIRPSGRKTEKDRVVWCVAVCGRSRRPSIFSYEQICIWTPPPPPSTAVPLSPASSWQRILKPQLLFFGWLRQLFSFPLWHQSARLPPLQTFRQSNPPHLLDSSKQIHSILHQKNIQLKLYTFKNKKSLESFLRLSVHQELLLMAAESLK